MGKNFLNNQTSHEEEKNNIEKNSLLQRYNNFVFKFLHHVWKKQRNVIAWKALWIVTWFPKQLQFCNLTSMWRIVAKLKQILKLENNFKYFIHIILLLKYQS